MALRTPSVISIRRMLHTSLALWLFSAILAASLTITAPALAQEGTWQPIGPTGDRICESAAVVIVPGAAGKLLYTAGPGCGVFYSEDGGDTWAPRNQGLPASGATALAVAPSLSSRLYAGADRTVYRSDDGGLTWRKLTGFPGGDSVNDITRIIVHPTDPDILYAIRGGYAFWGSVNRLYRSLDGGESWAEIGEEYSTIYDVAFDPDLPRRVYSTGYRVVLRSDDNGDSWEALPLGIQRPYTVKKIHVATSTHIYAALGSGGGVYASKDSGGSWSSLNEGLSDTFIDALTGDPADPLTLYAAASGGDILRYNDADGWTLLADQGDTPFSAANWLTLDNASPPALLAATPQGLFHSQDGVQWRLLSQEVQDPRVNVHDLTVTAGAQGQLWVAAGQNGVFSRSTQMEEGVSWIAHNNGLEGQRVLSLAIDPQNQSVLYAGTETNLFKSGDGGQSWQESDQGVEPPPLPTPSEAITQPTGLSVTALAVDPSDSSRVYAGTSQSLFVSSDGGASWAASTDFADVPNWPIYPTIIQIAIAPSDPDILYAVARLGVQETHLFKSTDRGESWTLPTIGGVTIPLPQELAVDPQNAEILYGVSGGGVFGGGIWKSEDGGHIWQLIGPGVAGTAGSHIAIADQDGIVIAAAGVRGPATGEPRDQTVHLSWDGGKHWTPVDSGLDNTPVSGLAFDPTQPNHLYAGVAERGVMVADLTPQQVFLPAVFAR